MRGVSCPVTALAAFEALTLVLQGRIAILKVHSRGKTLSKDVDFEKIARRTPGMLKITIDSCAPGSSWHVTYYFSLVSRLIHHLNRAINCCAHVTGFTGADIQNLMNEAAILAARRNLKEVSKEEIADALERIVAGPEKKGAVVSEPKKRLVAYHEVRCFALAAAFSSAYHIGPAVARCTTIKGRLSAVYIVFRQCKGQ